MKKSVNNVEFAYIRGEKLLYYDAHIAAITTDKHLSLLP